MNVYRVNDDTHKGVGRFDTNWDANPTAKDKTVALFFQFDLTDPAKVEDALDWIVVKTIVFYRVFSEEVKRIK